MTLPVFGIVVYLEVEFCVNGLFKEDTRVIYPLCTVVCNDGENPRRKQLEMKIENSQSNILSARGSISSSNTNLEVLLY